MGPPVDEVTTKKVGDLLERRAIHRAAQEYEQADALHGEIEALGITLDTRKQTWRRARTDQRGQRYGQRR